MPYIMYVTYMNCIVALNICNSFVLYALYTNTAYFLIQLSGFERQFSYFIP